ncbi:MAG: glycosyltransferase family 9 protein, partial [Bacteriovoracia bacterium]
VGTREHKMWPLEYFKELTDLILKQYPNVQFIVPLSKSQLDEALKEKFISMGISSKVKNVNYSLDELPMHLAGARCYIGNDTGIKHLAVSLDIPSYTFFGPENPLEWHPYDTLRHKFFWDDKLECRKRGIRFCTLEDCSIFSCMRSITPERVMKQLKRDQILD